MRKAWAPHGIVISEVRTMQTMPLVIMILTTLLALIGTGDSSV